MAPTPDDDAGGALPNLVVIGAMKCGTSALHRYLDRHPQIAMSDPKELNFFIGAQEPPDVGEDEAWRHGNWHRGVEWYARQFPAEATVRGESSPGYTSPSYPGVAARMAALVPAVRLVYLVRDPVERAVSQYRHHRADGTERRPPEEALLDPASQYVGRSRYLERLAPFLARFSTAQIAIAAQEELLGDRRRTLRRLFAFAGADDDFWSDDLERRWHTARTATPRIGATLRARLCDAVRDDAKRLRESAGREFPSWSV